MPDFDFFIWISVVLGFTLLGIVSIILTLIGLPGIWLMITLILSLKLLVPEWIGWWTIVAAIVLALLAEAFELVAGAAGTKKVGGSRAAGFGAIAGGIVGAIAGSMFPPIIGAIIWGAAGAGIGAIAGELHAGTHWKETLPVGGAAATGKFVGTLAKGVVAIVIFVMFLLAIII